jgi:hypothetical protein
MKPCEGKKIKNKISWPTFSCGPRLPAKTQAETKKANSGGKTCLLRHRWLLEDQFALGAPILCVHLFYIFFVCKQPAKKQRLEEKGQASMDVVQSSSSSRKFGGVRDETLRLYYERLFPFGCMFRWLSYCNVPGDKDPLSEKDFFMRREFSFTLEGDIYIRYLTFKNQEEYKAAYIKRLPHKTDIGAVFNAPPKQHNAVASFKPVEKVSQTSENPKNRVCAAMLINYCARFCYPGIGLRY